MILLYTEQVIISFILVNGVPLPIFYVLSKLGWDPTNLVYLVTLLFLTIISTLILTELIFASVASCYDMAPKEAKGYAPPASAIICAFLPNEQSTIVETILHFLTNLEYDGGLVRTRNNRMDDLVSLWSFFIGVLMFVLRLRHSKLSWPTTRRNLCQSKMNFVCSPTSIPIFSF